MTNLAPHTTSFAAGLRNIQALEEAGVMSDVGLRLDRFQATYDECDALFFMVGKVRDVSAWVLGDLLLYTEAKFGQTYAQIGERIGYAEQTLLNYVRVSNKVPYSERVPGLKHSHHEAVASLRPVERAQWLSRALEGGWSVSLLREHLRYQRNGESAVEVEALPTGLIEVVRIAIRDAIPTDDGRHYLVSREVYRRLRAAIEEE